MVAARFDQHRIEELRTNLRSLRARNQTHLHFTKENPARRAKILTAVLAFDPTLDIYDARTTREAKGRTWALGAIVADTVLDGPGRIIVEQDESTRKSDLVTLYAATKNTPITFAILPKRTDPALWAADAIAWCWANSSWRPRIRAAVRHHRCAP
jgi:hypothetical protein